VVFHVQNSLLFIKKQRLQISKSIILYVAFASSPLHPCFLKPILRATIAGHMDLLLAATVVTIVSVHFGNDQMNFYPSLHFRLMIYHAVTICINNHTNSLWKRALGALKSIEMEALQIQGAVTITLCVACEFLPSRSPMMLIHWWDFIRWCNATLMM
jgi:hypothetical protein